MRDYFLKLSLLVSIPIMRLEPFWFSLHPHLEVQKFVFKRYFTSGVFIRTDTGPGVWLGGLVVVVIPYFSRSGFMISAKRAEEELI